MRVALLASGSKGNAAFIEMDGVRVLIDAGIGIRRIKHELGELGEDVASLDAILLTHEHNDHIKGLKALMRACDAPVYARRGTLRALPHVSELPHERLRVIDDKMEIGSLKIATFNILHDAAEPVGYSLLGSRKLTVATDLGFVTDTVQKAIEGSDVLVLEANHDREMLKKGPYPWPLKTRILGNRGHLANSDTAWTLARMKKKPAKIFLAHLSEQNNTPDIAEDTVRAILTQQGAPLSDMDISLGAQDAMVTM
ncbi:MAG: MBL fold metallo-hydrolase [Selenomonadaceae bacterium]